MENMSQPSPPQEPNEVFQAIEARLCVLERLVAAQLPPPESMGADERALTRAELFAELDQYGSQLRDCKKALVERIADVDDDRRATASRLQRAWQTQSEEIEERLSRHARLWGGVLLLFVVLFAVALFVVYHQAPVGQPQVDAKIRAQLAQLSQEGAKNEQVREKLERLTTEFATIASALGQLGQNGEQALRASQTAERAVREQAEKQLAAEIHRLGAEQMRIAGILESLQSALRAMGSGGFGGRVDAVDPVSHPVSSGSDLQRPADEVDAESAVGTGPKKVEEEPAVAEAKEVRAAGSVTTNLPGGEETAAVVPVPEDTLVAAGDLYALQLIGFFSRESLDEFVARTELPAQVYVLRQRNKGRPWFALIHSLHDDAAAAEEELSHLSPDLKSLEPWIRPLPGVAELQIINTLPEPGSESDHE